jgi:hypothetical protein
MEERRLISKGTRGSDEDIGETCSALDEDIGETGSALVRSDAMDKGQNPNLATAKTFVDGTLQLMSRPLFQLRK